MLSHTSFMLLLVAVLYLLAPALSLERLSDGFVSILFTTYIINFFQKFKKSYLKNNNWLTKLFIVVKVCLFYFNK